MQALEEPSADDDAAPMSAPMPAPMYDMIELLYFAYRDFVGDADRLLEDYGFGRAHHRVLHFVARHPGLTIAELLDILAITKQSLNRVLKALVAQDFIEARAGAQDRRQRRLHATGKGGDLALKLASAQTRRLAAAMRCLGPDAKRDAAAFLLEMIDCQARGRVLGLIGAPPDARS
jgi:DNA-binding MarR family transcriptional regulator